MRPLALFLILVTASVAAFAQSVGTSPSPATPWIPPANAVPPPVPQTATTLPANFTPGTPVALADIVDVALTNNPATRVAWLQAKASEAFVGVRRAQYWPEVDLNVNGTASRVVTQGGRTITNTTSYGPSATLNYLLFDFGGRSASVEEARQLLISSDFLHNQAIQDVILLIEQAYYGYLNNRALLEAQDLTIKERQTELEATQARHNAGVATIADVLQAKTALSQAQLTRESFEGAVRIAEGQVASAMGLPTTARFELGNLPSEIPAAQVQQTVETLIAQAMQQRPQLAALRAQAEAARQRVTEVRSSYLPTIGVTGSIAQTWYTNGSSTQPYSIGVGLRWPVFTGFRNRYDVRQAQAEEQIVREDVRGLELQVDLQVWTSYYGLRTAEQRLGTARDLLASAQQSADVATSRYRAGVGSILDVLTAESALGLARAQEVQARADWFLSVAQLAHDTGTLQTK